MLSSGNMFVRLDICFSQRIPKKGKEGSAESEWIERTMGMMKMMGDKNSERRKTKAKSSMPSRLVSRDQTRERSASKLF